MSSGPAEPLRDGGSFRDPTSRVHHDGSRIIRTLNDEAYKSWTELRSTRFFSEFSDDGRVIGTRELEASAVSGGSWSGALEHDRVPAISYPYEWSFSMLQDAALLTLDLMAAALEEDMILKDATPFNVQFIGSRPTFIDIGSFQHLEEGEAWVGYRQFCRMFLYPLMLRSYKGIPFQPWLRGRLDGISSNEFRRMLRPRDLLKPGVLLHVALQARAERRYEASRRDVRSEIRQAGFKKELIENNVRQLRKLVGGLKLDTEDSEWSNYASSAHVGSHRDVKSEFLNGMLDKPGLVWDIGANDGHFSRLAANSGAYVLSIDSDEVVSDRFYRSLTEGETILPLVMNLGDPSPDTGWRQRERPSLDDRAAPDLVIMFAVIHHLVIGGNIPLGGVVDWLADLGTRAVVEFVPIGDPMTDLLMANKRSGEVHSDYSEESFRLLVKGRFTVDAEHRIEGSDRVLFSLTPVAVTG